MIAAVPPTLILGGVLVVTILVLIFVLVRVSKGAGGSLREVALWRKGAKRARKARKVRGKPRRRGKRLVRSLQKSRDR